MSESSTPEMPQPTMQYRQNYKQNTTLYAFAGVLCAIIGLFILPEILCSAGIILGAYTWKLDCNEQKNRGLSVIIIGIVALLLGIYYTAYFGLFNILP